MNKIIKIKLMAQFLFIAIFISLPCKAETLLETLSKGKSQVDFKYASPNDNQYLALYMNDVYVGEVEFDSTGSWSAYTRRAAYKLDQAYAARGNQIRLENISQGSANLDYLRIHSPAQQTLESENSNLGGGAYAVTKTQASNSMAVYGLNSSGAYCEFTSVNGGTMGEASLTVAYASTNGATLNIDVADKTSLTLILPPTSGADDYSGKASREIDAKSGSSNTMTISVISGDVNLDYVSLIASNTLTTEMEVGSVGNGATISIDNSASGNYAIKNMAGNSAYCELAKVIWPSMPVGYGYTISRNYSTDYKIVTPDSPSEQIAFAADELKSYLETITGATFPVVAESTNPTGKRIFVGAGNMSEAIVGTSIIDSLGIAGTGDDGFLVRYVNEDIILIGEEPRGTLYAVFSFLEKEVGCRWFNWHGDEYLPQINGDLDIITVDRYEHPAFLNRDMYWNPRYNYLEKEADFLLRTRMNGPSIASNTLDVLDTKYGGGAYEVKYPSVHSAFYYVEPDTYFATHPEYYGMFNGARWAFHLNWLDSGLRSTLQTNVASHIDTYGDGIYSISQNDTFFDFSDDSASLALYASEGTNGAALFQCLANMANTFKTSYPNVMLSTLAYRKSQTEVPPSTITFPDNVIVRFAAFDDDFSKSLLDTNNAETKQNLEGWTDVTQNLWTWYYPCAFGHKGALPYGNLTRLYEDFSLYAQNGLNGHYVQYDNSISFNHDLSDLKIWLINKLLWNPSDDIDAMVIDFAGHYYGKAAPEILEYIAAVEEGLANMGNFMTSNPGIGQYRYLTNEFLVECQGIFDEAEQAVASDSTLFLRVKQARMSLDRACLLVWYAQWRPLKDYPGINFKYSDLKTRYQSTNNTTVTNRVNPNLNWGSHYVDLAKAYVDDFIAVRDMITTPLASLPAPLNTVPAAKIKQITADFGGHDYNISADSNAANGIATVMQVEHNPVKTCVVDFDGTRHWVNIQHSSIPNSGYNFYYIGRFKLSEVSFLAFGTSWADRFSGEQFYDPQNPNKEWDIYASMRFEGAFYPYGGAGTGKIYIDRVIYVDTE